MNKNAFTFLYKYAKYPYTFKKKIKVKVQLMINFYIKKYFYCFLRNDQKLTRLSPHHKDNVIVIFILSL